jgi:four helix bundle protein
MSHDNLKQRTKQFALRVIRMSQVMPRSIVGDVLSRQIVRSATSVAANNRSASRGKSRADFVAKMALVEEEADETALWLELIAEAGLLLETKTTALHAEAGELTAIAVASILTARVGRKTPPSPLRTPHSK